MLGVPDEGNQTVCQSVLVCKHGSVCVCVSVYEYMCVCVCDVFLVEASSRCLPRYRLGQMALVAPWHWLARLCNRGDSIIESLRT